MKRRSTYSQAQRLVTLLCLLVSLVFSNLRSQAQTATVIYNFDGGAAGGYPLAGLVIDKEGNLYGTASIGGIETCQPLGCGTVFKIDTSGNLTVLYSFQGGTDGSNPQSRLFMDSGGDLYGTTYNGGGSSNCSGGCGTAFKINTSGNETVLYRFNGGTDGANPESALAVYKGNFYGTTYNGGADGYGTVFQLNAKRQETVIYSFTGGADGANPVADVTFDQEGRVYGTASLGGDLTCVNPNGTDGCGTVFALVPPINNGSWKEDVLYSFTGQTDGEVPWAGLTAFAGKLYGAATAGGQGGPSGGGTVFELTPSKGSWSFNLIYAFPGWGISGTYRDLFIDKSGNIWATTHCDGSTGAGTAYELSPPVSGGTWTYTLLYDFAGNNDGAYLHTNLVFSQQGNLYGTAEIDGLYGFGTVFEITP